MLGYAESKACRRIPLLAYFGEKFTQAPCEMCDNCLAGQKELVDLTIPAQKFFSCVSRTGQKFGANHIIEVLRGSQSEKVLKFGHSNLSTYNIGKEFSKKQWLHLSRQFLQEGLLVQDLEYGGLQLTPKAHEVLRGQERFFGTVQIEKTEAAPGKEESIEYDSGLFDLLRKLRKELADEQNVPPYVVFPDKTLTEMAAYLPQSRASLRHIHGVGEAKLEKYGTAFLQEISRYCREHGLHEKPRSAKESTTTGKAAAADSPITPKTMLIAEAFNAGKSVTELAQQFENTPRTILEHLNKCLRQGRVMRVEGLLECSRLEPSERDKVLQAFEKLGPDFLKPIFQALDEKVSYDELHVLRLYYLSLLNLRKEQHA
jgi:ATP-dependent DNA helicase RecQ